MGQERRDWANNRVRASKNAPDPFAGLGDGVQSTDHFDLLPVDAECLRDAIAAWTGRGYAITFGRTGDGGAMGVHLLAGGDKRSRYFSDVSELEDFLTRLHAPAHT
jgi:hypothetical protein